MDGFFLNISTKFVVKLFPLFRPSSHILCWSEQDDTEITRGLLEEAFTQEELQQGGRGMLESDGMTG